MERILKCYGSAETLEGLIKGNIPSLDGYKFFGKCNDTMIVFDDISDDDYDDVSELLDEYVYNDSDVSLSQTLTDFLLKNGIVTATAESCTGGMVASAIIDNSGVSDIFYEGVVTYSNESKTKRLGVQVSTLENYGAVSEETAMEMAMGLLDGKVKLGISVTGVAGPTGSEEKPVGLVFIGIAGENSCEVVKNLFDGNRRNIRTCAKNAALFYAYRHVLRYY